MKKKEREKKCEKCGKLFWTKSYYQRFCHDCQKENEESKK